MVAHDQLREVAQLLMRSNAQKPCTEYPKMMVETVINISSAETGKLAVLVKILNVSTLPDPASHAGNGS